jgi:DNA invertase Pin-like site-specific DNA recombinase
MTIKIAAYIRVSTDDQKIDSQLDAIKNYCKFKDWPEPVLFIDHGESGKKESRPQLDEMLKRIKHKEFNSLIVFKFDRLSRSTIQLIQLMELFKSFDVNFISLGESIDTTTPAGKMIFGIFAVLAEFERENIVERVKAGIRAAKAKGIHCGRDAYKTTPETIELIVELSGQGRSLNQIKDAVGLDKGYISRILKKNRGKT